MQGTKVANTSHHQIRAIVDCVLGSAMAGLAGYRIALLVLPGLHLLVSQLLSTMQTVRGTSMMRPTRSIAMPGVTCTSSCVAIRCCHRSAPAAPRPFRCRRVAPARAPAGRDDNPDRPGNLPRPACGRSSRRRASARAGDQGVGHRLPLSSCLQSRIEAGGLNHHVVAADLARDSAPPDRAAVRGAR